MKIVTMIILIILIILNQNLKIVTNMAMQKMSKKIWTTKNVQNLKTKVINVYLFMRVKREKL